MIWLKRRSAALVFSVPYYIKYWTQDMQLNYKERNRNDQNAIKSTTWIDGTLKLHFFFSRVFTSSLDDWIAPNSSTSVTFRLLKWAMKGTSFFEGVVLPSFLRSIVVVRLKRTTTANSSMAPTTNTREHNRYTPKAFKSEPDGLSDCKINIVMAPLK